MTSEENHDLKLEVEEVKDADRETCCTFIMHDEDHTLSNALRYMISKNPDVEFCGYSMPHPSENKINFRIQTKGASASDVLRKGLEDLNSVCEHVLATFKTSVENFQVNQERDKTS